MPPASSSQRRPSSRPPGVSAFSICGRTSRTTWWPSGVSIDDRGSMKRLKGSSWLPWTTWTFSGPRSVVITRSRAMATSVAPVRSTMASITARSQAMQPSWLPESTTRWRPSAPSTHCFSAAQKSAWVSRMGSMRGSTPASISKPSPAMTTAPPPVQAPHPVDQGPGAGRGGVGHGGAQVQVGDHDAPRRPGRSRSRRGRARGGGWRWCSAPGRRPRPRGWPGWSAAAPARGAGSGRG